MINIRDVHAKDALRELDRHETSVLEAKNSPAGHKLKIWAETVAATTEG
jgi:hypothetical protein